MTLRPAQTARHAEADTGPAAPADPVRAAAMIPAELLQDGEIIVLLLKPHPLYIVLAPLRILVILTLATTLAVLIDARLTTGANRQSILIVGITLILARLFWQFLEWLSRVYIMTDRRLIAVAGVLRVRVFETPLQNITHSEMLFSIRERLFGLGTLGFYTAGTGMVEAYWIMLATPLEVHRRVVEALRRYRR